MSFANALHAPRLHGRSRDVSRWVQLVSGTVAMMVIATVYAWPLLRSPSGAELGKNLAALENAFATFIFVETLFVPLEAWLGERRRPRLLLLLGLALVALGALAGVRAETPRLQAWYALGGAGAGIVYGGTVARAVKRFTDRKAQCIGVTAAAIAGVLALALFAYVKAITAPGAITVLVVIGVGQATIVLIATLWILKPPPAGEPPAY
jgi:OFA family oxalate/formate antiporter-like MFS transporter